jgi:hypothetical protein
MKVTDVEIIRKEALKRQMEFWNKSMTAMYIQSATMELSEKRIPGVGTVRPR